MRRISHSVYVRQEDVDSDGSWAISYGDMITLLLAFFVLYFSTDPKDARQRLINHSLLVALNPAAIVPEKTGHKNYMNLGEDEANDISKALLGRLGGKVREVGQRVLVEFPEKSFFELGAVDVNEDGRRALQTFAQKYVPFAGSYSLGIKAFTDLTPVRIREGRRYNDNLELSALRSVSAMRVLQRSGIPLSSMKVSGYGEYEKFRGIAQDEPRKPDALARKVILIIEPKMERDL